MNDAPLIPAFDYDAAFSRNLGWTTDWEQASLRARRVAIAGMGGVGGVHLLTLARTGIGAFNIADFDRFDVVNMNRQVGATTASLGRPKVDVLAEMAHAINPGALIHRFPDGVTEANLDDFLDGCDLYVDGLDFFALSIRARVFARCAELGIPAVTAAPIGMGTGFIAFLPGRMSFESYFRLEGQPEQEQYLRFLMGVAPRGLHRPYLADDTRVDLAGRRGPSTAAACELCAGMVATQSLKILLGRGGVPHAPEHIHFDAYRGMTVRTRLRWGNGGPIQRLKLALGRRFFGAMTRRVAARGAVVAPLAAPPDSPMMRVLDLARWAPSGDNVQPWRFEIVDQRTVVIHLASEAATNPYEYRDGEPTLLAGGMLLESMSVAASLEGCRIDWEAGEDRAPWRIVARLVPDASVSRSPLAAMLPMRSVARRALGARRLTSVEKAALAVSLGPGLELCWFESLGERLKVARLGAAATDIRLRAPETFGVHRKVVDWARERSPDGLPARAIGLNRPTRAMMRWAMRDWTRMHRMNAVLGTAAAAMQLDWQPALASSAFFTVRDVAARDVAARDVTARDVTARGVAAGGDGGRVSDLLRAGAGLQRFWLTASRLGLDLQPALATLIFADYGARKLAFSRDGALGAKAETLASKAIGVLGPLETLRFIGRIGPRSEGVPGARSIRKPLAELLVAGPT